jgi:hypothetical protein
MSSPNVQIQNLMRRYVKERDGIMPFNIMVKSLMSPSESSILDSLPVNNSLVILNTLQTSHLYNFKSSFNYTLNEEVPLLKIDSTDDDLIFEIEMPNNRLPPRHESLSSHILNINMSPTAFSHKICDPKINADYKQYLGPNGIMNNVFGAELVDVKWILYGFIISKINKSFRTNILEDNIKINSLHLGSDSGSVQSVLNHLFTSSTKFTDNKVQWKWATISRSNELYSLYKSNFIPLVSTRPYWEQATFIINKTSEITDRFNIIIHQLSEDNLRNKYLFTIIMALRFTNSQSVLLLELPDDSEWGLLEINVMALCGLIYDAVYLTKYDIGKNYNVLICRDKKKNLNTMALIKKMLKIMLESNSICFVDRQVLTNEWLECINNLIKTPLTPISFAQITESLKNDLLYNEHPLM